MVLYMIQLMLISPACEVRTPRVQGPGSKNQEFHELFLLFPLERESIIYFENTSTFFYLASPASVRPRTFSIEIDIEVDNRKWFIVVRVCERFITGPGYFDLNIFPQCQTDQVRLR